MDSLFKHVHVYEYKSFLFFFRDFPDLVRMALRAHPNKIRNQNKQQNIMTLLWPFENHVQIK